MQINVTKLRRLALDTDGEANDGEELGSGQEEAPEACDVEFAEILGRWGDALSTVEMQFVWSTYVLCYCCKLCLVGWLIGWLIGWFVGWLVG